MVDGVIGATNVRVKKNGHTSIFPFQFYCDDYAHDSDGKLRIRLSPIRRIDDTNVPISAGMQVEFLPSHKIGYIVGEMEHERMDLIFPVSQQELELYA